MIMHSENSASKHKFVFVEDPAQLSWPCVSIKSWRSTICKDTKVRFLGTRPLHYAAPNVKLSARNLRLITFAVPISNHKTTLLTMLSFYFFPSDLQNFRDKLNRSSKTAHTDI